MMPESPDTRLRRIMAEAGRQAIPPDHDLWPAIRQRLAARAKHDRQHDPTRTAHDDDRDMPARRPYPNTARLDDQPIRAATWPRQVAQFAGAALALLLVGAVLVVVFRDEDRSPDRDTGIAASPIAPIASSATPTAPEPAQTPIDPTSMTLEDVYRRAGEYLQSQDGILHLTITTDWDSESYVGQSTVDRWIDAQQDLARETSHTAVTDANGQKLDLEGTDIISADGKYLGESGSQGFRTQPTRTCYGGSVAVSSLLGCPGIISGWTTTLQLGEYEGHEAIVLIRDVTSRGGWTHTSRLYLDRTTLIPLLEEAEGEDGSIQRRSYYHEFIPRDVLPSDFFDPTSIGYVVPAQPLDCAGSGFVKYWLGERIESGNDLPPLVMHVDSSLPTPTYNICVIELTYGSAITPDAPSAIPMVELEQSLRADWDAHAASGLAQTWDQQQPCQQREEISLANGNAIIFMGYLEPPMVDPGTPVSCPDRPYDQIQAVAYLGDTVVSITAWDFTTRDGVVQSPYHSLEGMRAIVTALQPYPSAE